MIWRDVEFKANFGMYLSLTELYSDCLLVAETLLAYNPSVNETLPNVKETITTTIRDVAVRWNMSVDL